MYKETNNNPEKQKNNRERVKRKLGTLALAIFFAGAGVGVGITKGVEALSHINVGSAITDTLEHVTSSNFNFSNQTKGYIVQPGEGLYNAVGHIDNISSIPMDAALNYVENMPENKDTLKDGLQAFESVAIPDRVDK